MPDTDTDQLSGKSPSTPPSSTSTREPASMDGWRSHDEIRADLATEEGRGSATRQSPTGRLVADVEPLLAEIERLRVDNERLERHRAVWQANCEDNSAVCDLLQSVIDSLIAERDAARGVVQAVEAPEAIEAAAMALYEDTRDPGYDTPEWDWPNIDRSYDKPDEDETDPEWLRNLYRREARVAIRAALAASLPVPTEDADEGNAHVTETYRQTINGREQLGWQCVTCLTHQLVCAGPGMGKPVPATDVALLDRLAAEHVIAAAVPTVPTEPTCEHGHMVSHYIDSKTAQYHQLDNICHGPVPTEDVTR